MANGPRQGIEESLPQEHAAPKFTASGWKRATDHTKTVRILAGVEKTAFDAHESLLKSQSTCFRNALNGDWLEARQKVFELKEDNPTIVEFFVDWLYTKNINIVKEAETDLFLVEAYLFAERRGVPLFQNAIINKLHETMGDVWYPPLQLVSKVHAESLPTSKLRLFFVDKWIWAGSHLCAEEEETADISIPSDFFVAVLRGMAKYSGVATGQIPLCTTEDGLHFCDTCQEVLHIKS